MIHPPVLPGVLLLALSVAMSGCAANAEPSKRSEGPESEFLMANDQAMDQMMAGMNVKPSGDIDRDFARMMIPHHQGGIDMAKAELRYGKNEELKALARAIVSKQEEEIALMRHIIGEKSTTATPMAMPEGMDMSQGSHHHM